jgi:hypothetical protein
MDAKIQRRAGMRLALAANAADTQEAIKDESSCYKEILTAAVADVGLDTTVAKVLESNPEWASQMLQHIPDLGAHRDALLQKAASAPASALDALRNVPDLGSHRESLVLAAGRDAQPLGNISAFHLKDSGGFDCQFTMYWIHAGETQPKKAYPDSSKWTWSSTLLLGQSQTMACRNFALVDAPLEAGDEVWIFVSVKGGKDNESPLRFIYDPTTVNCAVFTISGTTTDNALGYSQMTAAAPMVKVSIAGDKATCSPDEVVVQRGIDTGVQWHMDTAGYKFTGIDINADGTQDFGAATLSSDGSVMTVTDTVTDLGTFTYDVLYENTATHEKGSFDPGIKNKD